MAHPSSVNFENLSTILHRLKHDIFYTWNTRFLEISSHILNDAIWWLWYTVECRYNTVTFVKILHSTLRWQWQNISQTLDSQKTPHTSPLRASSGVSFVRILEEIDRVITAPHCNCDAWTSDDSHVCWAIGSTVLTTKLDMFLWLLRFRIQLTV